MTENHKKFLSHLSDSNQFVWLVAKWLQSKGHNVKVNSLSQAERHEDWKENTDAGDLYIEQRIEVKHLSVMFTNATDWPYRDKFIVCAKHSYDRSTPKPYVYIILNSDASYAAIVKKKPVQVGMLKKEKIQDIRM